MDRCHCMHIMWSVCISDHCRHFSQWCVWAFMHDWRGGAVCGRNVVCGRSGGSVVCGRRVWSMWKGRSVVHACDYLLALWAQPAGIVILLYTCMCALYYWWTACTCLLMHVCVLMWVRMWKCADILIVPCVCCLWWLCQTLQVCVAPSFPSPTTTSLHVTPTSQPWASKPWVSTSPTSMCAWTRWPTSSTTLRSLWSPHVPWSTCASESCLPVGGAWGGGGGGAWMMGWDLLYMYAVCVVFI